MLRERPDLRPAERDARQVDRALRYIAGDNGFNLNDPRDRQAAQKLLASDSAYRDLQPPSWHEEYRGRPRSTYQAPPEPVPAIPAALRESVAELASELGLRWDHAEGRKLIALALCRRNPTLARQLPEALKAPHVKDAERRERQAKAEREYFARLSPYSSGGAS